MTDLAPFALLALQAFITHKSSGLTLELPARFLPAVFMLLAWCVFWTLFWSPTLIAGYLFFGAFQ